MFSNNEVISYEYLYLEKERLRLAYKKIGNGQKNILLFHGYGQDCHCWGKISKSLKEEYTFYCFDLPFHGQTNDYFSENSTEISSKNKLEVAFKTFLEKNKITDFSVLGFSLGARLALFCAEIFPQNIQNIYLLAPDGIKNNFWFGLATRFWFSKMLFNAFLTNQKIFIKFGKILSKIGLLDKSILNFVINQTNSQEKRQKIYNTWCFFANIPSISIKKILAKITQTITTKKQFLSVFLAKYDIFITEKNIKQNLQNIDFKIVTFDCNHFKLPLLLEDILASKTIANLK